MNQQLLDRILQSMGIRIPIKYSESFLEITGDKDPRHFIHPKMELEVADPSFKPRAYHQVFSDRHGFQANLSILDLVFNEGPAAMGVLRESLRI